MLTNVAMTVVEVVGLLMILVIAAVHVVTGGRRLRPAHGLQRAGRGLLAIVSGVAFSFFAMTGFENAVNVAEEVIEPEKAYPRALIGGVLTAGVIYVLVSMAAAVVVDVDTLAGSDAALLEVVEAGVLPDLGRRSSRSSR